MYRVGQVSWFTTSHKFDDFLGKVVYGNAAGFARNRAGWKRLKKYRASVDNRMWVENSVSQDLESSGFAICPDIDRDVLKSVYSRYVDLLNSPKSVRDLNENQKDVGEGEVVYRRLLRNSVRDVPEVMDLLNNEVLNSVRSWYRTEVYVNEVYMWRNEHVPVNVLNRTHPYSSTWHCDYRPSDMIKLFIVMSNVTASDGPLHYVSKERTRELMKVGFVDRYTYGLSDEILEDPAHVHKLVGEPGTAAFCNTALCLHRAGIPEPGHRRDILEFTFYSSDVPFSKAETIKRLSRGDG